MIGAVTVPEEEVDSLAGWLESDRLATLEAFLGDALDVVGVMDSGLRIRYLNWAAPGLVRDELIGAHVLDLVPPDQREEAKRVYESVLATGVGARFETVYKDGDGMLMWDVRVGPIRVEGKVVGLIAITSNVTEQRRARADRDRFFSLSLDMLVVVSPNGKLKSANPAFAATMGYLPSELIGKPFIELVHPDDRARTQSSFERVRGGTPELDFENRYLTKAGEARVFSWRANADPITGHVYAVARDVTEHRLTETRLRHTQKMEAIGQLAGGVAHDFNNLLLAVLGNADLARGAMSTAELKEYLDEIEAAARRAADLTKQLLAFSRGQASHPVPIDLNHRIGSLMNLLRRLLPESIAIELVPGQNLPSVNADPGQLEQVIVNLCVNARDAMERGGQLTLKTSEVTLDGRRHVLLSVRDTGAGMTPEVRERAFEPFFTTKGAQHGTGLGLSTVYGIVQQHGGAIQLHSEPGRGTTFEIYLPADERLATEVEREREPSPPRGHETILIAEDEESVRRAVVQLLQRAGYRTIAVANGAEAVRALSEHPEPVHLALLDVVMPELGGPDAWAEMQPLRPGLRVLFASGYADERYRRRLPPDAEVIEKPFRIDDLLRRLRATLDR
jgi:PAS domain S-box-containing protein